MTTPPFVLSVFPLQVVVRQGTATFEQAMALCDLLDRTAALGSFRQLVSGTSVELRFGPHAAVAVQAYLDALTLVDLAPFIAARAEALAITMQVERLLKASLYDFGRTIVDRSNGKLQMKPMVNPHKLVLTTSDLLPITHFKTLARLTRYDGKAKTFTVSDDTGVNREGLLELAGKLAKSTKKVAKADIDARHASRATRPVAPTDDEIDELIWDIIGFGDDDPKHRQWAREHLKRG